MKPKVKMVNTVEFNEKNEAKFGYGEYIITMSDGSICRTATSSAAARIIMLERFYEERNTEDSSNVAKEKQTPIVKYNKD